MQNRQAYDQVFQKIWGASGGLAAIMCPCGVLYSLKFNIRAEGPRDFADMLLSWKHMPNISVYDFARGLVNHTNVRVPENPPFQPNEGRLAPPTPENIQAAKDRTLKIHLPWLLEPNTENFKDLKYVLDPKRNPDETIIRTQFTKVQQVTLQRRDFLTLGLARELEATLRERQILFPDSFHLEASVGFGDQRYIQICSDLAQRIIPGEWTVIYSKDIKGLPRQEDGNACGIFMLMYALYIVLGADFDFTTGDMDTIRTWWCLLLLSGHSVVRFAQKRKYEDPIIIADKDKEEAKRPRTIPPQQSEPVDLTKEGILEGINVSLK
ncbi:hypothetical protein PFLUV_G00052810 [Perca fluviatilis]|uniref:Ubiquitin-like protease family profile domain-containing protein n=1 Tax=Perca fluviatilis TaxID=8168 RepID=A0A6A5FC44_PERFL|nr:hypothetical protein PFLUV_G00052810 [Perca fluviatilis]